MERRKMTSRALSQRAAKTRRAGSQRTSRGPADSSSWSGTTPHSPTRTTHTRSTKLTHTHTHAHSLLTHTHSDPHTLLHPPLKVSCPRSHDIKRKKKSKKEEKFPSAYTWSKFSCCYPSGGTRCSVVITRLLIFTLLFFYLLYLNSQENLAFYFELCEEANPALSVFLSDTRLSNAPPPMYIHRVMLVGLFAAVHSETK